MSTEMEIVTVSQLPYDAREKRLLQDRLCADIDEEGQITFPEGIPVETWNGRDGESLLIRIIQRCLRRTGKPFAEIEGGYVSTRTLHGSAGGFAAVITPTEGRWMSTGRWLQEQEQTFANSD